ncbi:MAG: hypothetical protein ACK6D1_02560 [Planctomycetota bacterium]
MTGVGLVAMGGSGCRRTLTTQQATSNALEWTVASAAPSLGMALLEGQTQKTTGTLSVHLAHVLRFEAQ